jgi:peptidylprolyl isomerase/peptidyl-prolyl cis-trans isomerase B (cyclophilin B)
MIQGGDPESKGAVPGARLGSGGPGYTIPAEIVPGMVHTKGALAAARQGDQVNPEKRSSGSQFYIVDGRTFNAADLRRQVESKRKRYYQSKSRAYFNAPENAGAKANYRSASQSKDQEAILAEEQKLYAWVDAKYGPAPVINYTDEQLQSYATNGGAPHLDGDYTVFGQVVEGLDVIDKISAVEKAAGDRPITDITMKMKVVK